MKAFKLKQKLSDWKTWAFTVLPFAMIAAGFIICVYVLATRPADEVTLGVCGLALVDVAICLMVFPSSVNRIKEKRYLSAIVALLAFACYIGLSIAVMSYIPDMVAASNEKDARREEYEQTAFEDADHMEKLQLWGDAVDKYNDISLKMQWLEWGGYAAVAVSSIALDLGKKKKEEDEEQPVPTAQSEGEQPAPAVQNEVEQPPQR